MARLSLSKRELYVLNACLSTAIDDACIPDWEFEALIGCSRKLAQRGMRSAVRRLETRQERPSEPLMERMTLLLSALLGASSGDEVRGAPQVAARELEQLVELLCTPAEARTSGIKLRSDAQPRPFLAQR